MERQRELFKAITVHYTGRTGETGAFTRCGRRVHDGIRTFQGNRNAARFHVNCLSCLRAMGRERRERLAAGVPAELA